MRVDNLYLDMTHIINPYAHLEDAPKLQNTEEIFTNTGTLDNQIVLAVHLHTLLYVMLFVLEM